MKSKKILIIGNEGYIGSFLFEFLKNKEHDVSGVDICWFGQHNKQTNKIDYKNLTCKDLEKYDNIILLAGHSSVKMCSGSFCSVLANNLINFTNLLSKLESLNKKIKLIYASSSSVYGSTGNIKAKENEINFFPHNNYDIVKHMSDLAVQRYNVEYYGLRFGTVNGYSPVMRDDIMINAMVSIANKTNSIKLFAEDTYRPILGINDLCRAIQSIITDKDDKRGIYNLASFNTTSKEMAKIVSQIMNVPIIIDNENNKSSYSFLICTNKFEKNFNFKFTDTAESICLDIIKKYDSIKLTNRTDPIYYEF